MIDEKEINKLKEEIAEAKQEKAECEGAIKALMQRLDSEFGLKTLKQADIKLRNLEKEIDTGKKELEQEWANLQRDFSW